MAADSKIDPQEPSLEDDMKPPSPTARNPSATKKSCLCAPTNHPGSFRCRRHRNSSSVGSNLSELGNRRTASVGANLHLLGNTNTNTKRSKEW